MACAATPDRRSSRSGVGLSRSGSSNTETISSPRNESAATQRYEHRRGQAELRGACPAAAGRPIVSSTNSGALLEPLTSRSSALPGIGTQTRGSLVHRAVVRGRPPGARARRAPRPTGTRRPGRSRPRAAPRRPAGGRSRCWFRPPPAPAPARAARWPDRPAPWPPPGPTRRRARWRRSGRRPRTARAPADRKLCPGSRSASRRPYSRRFEPTGTTSQDSGCSPARRPSSSVDVFVDALLLEALVMAVQLSVGLDADRQQVADRPHLERGTRRDPGQDLIEVVDRDQVRGGGEHAAQALLHRVELVAQRGDLGPRASVLARRGMASQSTW